MQSHKKKAYENLRYRIISQDLPPGELLMEKELMAHYGIGRTPLREIFIELQREGLIRRVPRAGTWVAPMDINYVKQIVEIRIRLERLGGELAAERITDAQISKLEAILEKVTAEQASENIDVQRLIHYESQFHQLVYAATGNSRLEELLVEFQGIGARFWHSLVFNQEQLFKLFGEQHDMLAALKSRDAKRCGQLMADHARAYFKSINGIV